MSKELTGTVTISAEDFKRIVNQLHSFESAFDFEVDTYYENPSRINLKIDLGRIKPFIKDLFKSSEYALTYKVEEENFKYKQNTLSDFARSIIIEERKEGE